MTDNEAINCYEKTIEIKPDKDFYNLACMYSLQTKKQKSLSHLEKAILLNPTKYKPMAKQDEDFKNLWEDKDFLALVGE